MYSVEETPRYEVCMCCSARKNRLILLRLDHCVDRNQLYMLLFSVRLNRDVLSKSLN